MLAARIAGSSTLRGFLGEQQVLPLCAAFSAVAETIDQQRNTSEMLADIAAAKHGTYEPEVVHAFTRSKSGSISSEKLRKIREYRPSGVMSRLFFLRITEEDGSESEPIPALAKAIHKTAVNNELENVAWMHAPMGKIVDLEVPVRISGEDICPGIKRGGYVRYVRWAISCRCVIPRIPTQIALDVSKLELGSKIFPADIADELLAMGVLVREKHMGDPIIMISEAGSD